MSESGEEVSLSLDEMNQLRVKMGLKPLVPRAKKEEQPKQKTTTSAKNEEDGGGAVSARELLERLEAAKKRRGTKSTSRETHEEVDEVVKGKTIADEVDESDMDLSSWVQKSRAREKELAEEKKKAQRLQKIMDEQDLEEQKNAAPQRKKYGSQDLSGIHILHSADKFAEGDTILTLADVPLIDRSGNLTDQPDMLIAPEIAAEERRMKLKQRTKKGYDAVKELEGGGEVSILSKYDRLDEEMNEELHNADITSIGKHRPDKMMVIQGGRALESDQEKIATLRSRLNRIATIVPNKAPIVHYLPDTDGPLLSASKNKIDPTKLSFSLESQPLKVADDFMSLEEAASRAQFRKKSSKRSSDPDQPRRKRRQLRSESSTEESSLAEELEDQKPNLSSSSSSSSSVDSPFAEPQAPPASKRMGDDDHDDDHRSRSDSAKTLEDRIRRTQHNKSRLSAYSRAIEIANEQTRSLLLGDEAESSSVSDDSEMYERLSRSRIGRNVEGEPGSLKAKIRLDPNAIAQRIQNSQQQSHLLLSSSSSSASPSSVSDFLVLAPTTEFTRNIKLQSDLKEEEEEEENERMRAPPSVSSSSNDTTMGDESNGNGHHEEGTQDHESDEESSRGKGVEEIFGEEELASGSITAALALLRSRQNPMVEDSRIYQGRRKDDRNVVTDDPAPHIDLAQRDEFGRILTIKEAYRRMCYRFHGHTPSKNTMEKLKRREEQDNRRLNMSSTDTPLNTLERMKREQERTSLPFVVVGGSKKPEVMSSASAPSSLQKSKTSSSSSSSSLSSASAASARSNMTTMIAPKTEPVEASSSSSFSYGGYFSATSADASGRGTGSSGTRESRTSVDQSFGGAGNNSKLQFNLSGSKRKRDEPLSEQTPSAKRPSLFGGDDDEQEDAQ